MPKYSVGDHVVHGHDIGEVIEIIDDFRGKGPYYRLRSKNDESLMVCTPVEREGDLLRPVLTKPEAEELISQILSIETAVVETRTPDAIYKSMLDSGNHHDLVRLIKTIYLMHEEKTKGGHAKRETEKAYFRMAERLFYGELAVVYDMPKDKVKEYVADKLHGLEQAKALS